MPGMRMSSRTISGLSKRSRSRPCSPPLAGITSNVCVESTARDGYMLDYHIVLVEDCTASYSEEPHQATLANIRRAFGRVVTAEEVASVWREAGLLPKVAAAV